MLLLATHTAAQAQIPDSTAMRQRVVIQLAIASDEFDTLPGIALDIDILPASRFTPTVSAALFPLGFILEAGPRVRVTDDVLLGVTAATISGESLTAAPRLEFTIPANRWEFRLGGRYYLGESTVMWLVGVTRAVR